MTAPKDPRNLESEVKMSQMNEDEAIGIAEFFLGADCSCEQKTMCPRCILSGDIQEALDKIALRKFWY